MRLVENNMPLRKKNIKIQLKEFRFVLKSFPHMKANSLFGFILS